MKFISVTLLVLLTSIQVVAETAVCVGVQGTQIVELNDPYMTVARPSVRKSIKSAFKKRSSFTYKSGGILVKNNAWRYTRIPSKAVLKNLSFNDAYICESSEH